jgi:large subunit ribosomal protein L4
MPRKARRLAIKCALSAKVQNGEMVILEDFAFQAPKTKQVINMLDNLKVAEDKALIITTDADENVEKSARNIPGVKAIASTGVNVYDLLYHGKVLITKGAVARIEEVLA